MSFVNKAGYEQEVLRKKKNESDDDAKSRLEGMGWMVKDYKVEGDIFKPTKSFPSAKPVKPSPLGETSDLSSEGNKNV